MKNITKTLILALCIFLVSCSSNINSENYNKIKTGMTVTQVESILGKGDSQASSNVDLGEFGGRYSAEVMTWESGTKIISVTFENNRVSGKAKVGF